MAERGRYDDLDPDAAGERIGELYEQLAGEVAPTAWERVAELVQLLTAVHGAALERVLGLAQSLPDGDRIVDRIVGDPLVASLLVVHGLEPETEPSRLRTTEQPVHLVPRRRTRP